MRTIKIYGADQGEIAKAKDARVLAKYPAFLVAEVEDDKAEAIGRDYLTEDITDQFRIGNGGAKIDTTLPRIASTGATLSHPDYAADRDLPPGPHHYVVQFIGPIKKAWLAQARKAGADIVAPFESFSVIARIEPHDVAAVSGLKVVRWMGHLPYSARLSQQLGHAAPDDSTRPDPRTPRTKYLPNTYTVQFFRADLAAAARNSIKQAGFKILEEPTDTTSLIVSPKTGGDVPAQGRLDLLSRIHGVQRIAARPIRRTSNDHAAVIMKASAGMGNSPGLNLSGDGEIIAICDTGLDNGKPATIHPDFQGRIAAIRSYPISPDFSIYVDNPEADDGPSDIDSGHGTHTSGSIAGDGTASSNLPGLQGPVRGLAYRADLVFQAVEQRLDWKNPIHLQHYGRFLLAGLPSDLKSLFAFAYQKGARIHSNSWGGGDPGAYDDQCQQVDAFIWDKRDFCIIFAAGNDGRDGNANGIIDLGSVTPPGTAKNCITVGASENDRPQFPLTYGSGWPQDYPVNPISSDRLADNPDQIAAFSSRGPTADGRIKPDVVAPGTYILSTRSRMLAENNYGYGRFGPSSLYMFDSGTSMATPLTAGAVALIREFLRKSAKIHSPSAALLKASLIASALPIPATTAVPNNHQGFGRVALDDLLAPASPMKARFVEGPAIDTGSLDRRTVSVGQAGKPLKIVLAYSDFPGPQLVNNLNLIVTDPKGKNHVGNNPTNGGFDSSNNVEAVTISEAQAGDYIIQVIGSNVPSGPQPFALVVIGALAD